jgi:hypothetical protein
MEERNVQETVGIPAESQSAAHVCAAAMKPHMLLRMVVADDQQQLSQRMMRVVLDWEKRLP